ncbi:MAG: hypothetical protein ACKOPS_21410, partial [Cyanobium sp.]
FQGIQQLQATPELVGILQPAAGPGDPAVLPLQHREARTPQPILQGLQLGEGGEHLGTALDEEALLEALET